MYGLILERWDFFFRLECIYRFASLRIKSVRYTYTTYNFQASNKSTKMLHLQTYNFQASNKSTKTLHLHNL